MKARQERALRRSRGPRRQPSASVAADQLVHAEAGLVEEHRAGQAQAGVEVGVEGCLEALELDAQAFQQVFGVFAVEGVRRLQRLAAAVAEDGAPAGLEFVALGMAAEVVVVLDDEDARRGVPFAIEPGGGEAADAAADHHQVVFLFDRQVVDIEGLLLPAHLVCDFEGAWMATAQAGERGRIVAAAGGGAEDLGGVRPAAMVRLRRSGSRGGRWSWEVLCEAVGGSGSHVHRLLLRMRAERLASDADPQSRAGAEFRGPCRRVEGLSAGTRPLSGEM